MGFPSQPDPALFRIFHGTASSLGKKIRTAGFDLNAKEATPSSPSGGLMGKGVYASRKWGEADFWARQRAEQGFGDPEVLEGSLKGLNLKTDFSKSDHPSWSFAERAEEARREGFDGVMQGDEVLIFDPKKASKAFGAGSVSPVEGIPFGKKRATLFTPKRVYPPGVMPSQAFVELTGRVSRKKRAALPVEGEPFPMKDVGSFMPKPPPPVGSGPLAEVERAVSGLKAPTAKGFGDLIRLGGRKSPAEGGEPELQPGVFDGLGGVHKATSARGFNKFTKGGVDPLRGPRKLETLEKRNPFHSHNSLVRATLAPFKDTKTNLVVAPEGLEGALRSIDRVNPLRYEAVLRQMRGADPSVVKKLPQWMPDAHLAWKGQFQNKLEETEAILKEFNPKNPEQLKWATKSWEALTEAKKLFKGGDHVAASLAGDAAWQFRGKSKDGFRVPSTDDAMWAERSLEMAKVQSGQAVRGPAGRGAVMPKTEGSYGLKMNVEGPRQIPFGHEDWLKTFNPRVVENAERGGWDLLPLEEAEKRLRLMGDSVEEQLDRGPGGQGPRMFTSVPRQEREPMPRGEQTWGESKHPTYIKGMKGQAYSDWMGEGRVPRSRDWPKPKSPDEFFALQESLGAVKKGLRGVGPKSLAELQDLSQRMAATKAQILRELGPEVGANLLKNIPFHGAGKAIPKGPGVSWKLPEKAVLAEILGVGERLRRGVPLEKAAAGIAPEVGAIIKQLLKRL